MPYPGYLLNPGDMFQVEPEAVLFATGAPKDVTQNREGRTLRKSRKRVNVTMEKFRAQRREKKAVEAAARAEKRAAESPDGPVILAGPSKTALQDNLDV